MSNRREYDLSVIEDIYAYLADTPFASVNVTALSGGYGNWIFRLHLRAPYEGRQTLILKHGKSTVPNTEIPFSLERQEFEVEALRRIGSWLPNDSLVVVPAVHQFNKDDGVLIMDDCGEDAVTLKRLMLEGDPSVVLGGTIGKALGEFLGLLHAWGRDDKSVLDFFEGNRKAQQLSVWATYGRLNPTLTGSDSLPALCDPPLNVPLSTVETITKLAVDTSDTITTSRESFTSGDFWPGNVMINFHTDTGSGERSLQRVYVLDWEMCGAGLPGSDVGQWLAEMHLARRFHPPCAEASSKAIAEFLQSYRKTYGHDDTLARTAMVRVGVHLVVWTARIPWGSKEQTREVVQEGIEYLEGVSGPSDDWLKTSLVSILV